MKKILIKLICLCLSLSVALSLFACKPSEENNNDNNGVILNSHEDFDDFEARFGEYIDNTGNRNVVSDSNVVLYDKNSTIVSDYKILISNNDYSREAEVRAANEIQLFFLEATGYKLPIIRDSSDDFIAENTVNGEFTCSTSKKYISIGNTKIYNEHKDLFKDDMSFSNLGNDGFCIRTIGNLIVMNAIGNNGIIYSAYEFLERHLDFEFYALDVWHVTDDTTRNVLNMDIVEIPDFAARNLDTTPVHGGFPEYCQRLRYHGSQGGMYYDGMESAGWCLGDTSMCSQILKPTDYISDHAEWYSGDGADRGQLCFSALLANKDSKGLKPFDEFAKNLIRFIKNNPRRRIFMLGINDNSNYFCTCKDCTNEVVDIGYSGQMCLIANALSDYISKWQEGETVLPGGSALPEDLYVDDFNKERYIQIAFFSYQKCTDAPVQLDPVTGNYVAIPYDAPYECLGGNGEYGDGDYSDLYLRDNIVVRCATMNSYFMHPQYNMEYNSSAYYAFTQWQILSKNMAVWDYGTNFKDYLSHFPDLHTIQDNFKFYRYCGVTDILTQLPAHTNGTSFYALKIYLRAKLMWDIDQDAKQLIDNFLLAYYGPQAYDSVVAYLNFLTNYFFMLDATNSYIDETGREINAKGFLSSSGVRVEFHGYYYEPYISYPDYFELPAVIKLRNFLNEAESKLNAEKSTEKNYAVYLKHIRTESLWARYMELNNYGSYYSADERTILIDEFEDIATKASLKEFNHACKGANAGQVKRFLIKQRGSI